MHLKGQAIPTVCIDCRYAGSRPSGIGEVVRELARHAPALAPEMDFVLLKHPDAIERFSEAGNVSEVAVRFGTNHPASMWMLPEIAPVARCDLYHATANILPARLGMKTLTTIHDIMWLTNPYWCETGWKAPLKRSFYGHGLHRALARSDMIATVSASTRDAIAAYAPEAAGRTRVTLSGVSERFRPAPRDEEMLGRLGIGREDAFVLIVGQNAPYKNHERALAAFASFVSGHSEKANARAVFVQRQGGDNKTLRVMARKKGISDRVTFTGSVTQDDLVQLYSAARLLLHPSLCEGFGNPLAEAMACGCPVITSNRSAMPEVTGGAELLVDPVDEAAIAAALARLWADGDLREKMREAGLKRSKMLSWREFARANVAIYRELFAAH